MQFSLLYTWLFVWTRLAFFFYVLMYYAIPVGVPHCCLSCCIPIRAYAAAISLCYYPFLLYCKLPFMKFCLKQLVFVIESVAILFPYYVSYNSSLPFCAWAVHPNIMHIAIPLCFYAVAVIISFMLLYLLQFLIVVPVVILYRTMSLLIPLCYCACCKFYLLLCSLLFLLTSLPVKFLFLSWLLQFLFVIMPVDIPLCRVCSNSSLVL